MIEKKTVWAVTRDLKVVKRTAIVEDGQVLAEKDPEAKDSRYKGEDWFSHLRYFFTENEALAYAVQQEREVCDMVPRVKEFVRRMDIAYDLRKRMGIKKTDYLGQYGEDTDNYYSEFKAENKYAMKLETYISSGMLNIEARSFPRSEVRSVEWYGIEQADDYEPDEWRAELTLSDGSKVVTGRVEEVRLVWAVLGKCVGSKLIDDEIDYGAEE